MKYGKVIKVRLRFLLAIVVMLLTACATDSGPESLAPEIMIDEADSITRTSAVLSGTVRERGTGRISSVLFRYGTSAEALLSSVIPSRYTLPTGEVWKASVSDLHPGTTYYYCLSAGNGRSEVRSDIKEFTTMSNSTPTLSQLTVVSQGPTSIVCRYSIINDGGEDIVETGCYLTSADGKRLRIPSSSHDIVVGERQWTSIVLSNLEPNSEYSLSAYAMNKIGEAQSSVISFSTTDVITLGEAGSLSLLITDNTKDYLIDNGRIIRLSGPVNGDDIHFLRNLLADSLTVTDGWQLDLTEARIHEGGNTYGFGRFTEDNTIGYGMFANLALRSISLPESTEKVEYDAFSNSTMLREIIVPASVREISPSIGCESLEAINVSVANTHYTTDSGVLLTADGTQIVWFPLGKTGTYSLPPTVTSVSANAFAGSNIQSFSLHDGIVSVGVSAFQGCSRLTDVHLGKNIEFISDYAFADCPLAVIDIDAEIPPVCRTTAFSSFTATIYVPSTSVNTYKAHKLFGKFTVKSK